MNPFVDVLILVLGLAGVLALAGGCLVVAVYLGWVSRSARWSARVDPPEDALIGSLPRSRWGVHLLVVLLGGALLSAQSVLWLWHVVAHVRPALVVFAAIPANAGPARVNLFPWE